MKLFDELEDAGFCIEKLKEMVKCKHENKEGFFVPIKMDNGCQIGRVCRKCGMSGELQSFINIYNMCFLTYEEMLKLR